MDAFTFALLIIVLVFKPTGLFGEKATEKCKGREYVREKRVNTGRCSACSGPWPRWPW